MIPTSDRCSWPTWASPSSAATGSFAQAYDAVGIITFFTAGEPEVRGWNVEKGGTAVDAAGKIHTDLAKGFIRAEVTAYDDLFRAGSVQRGEGQKFATP